MRNILSLKEGTVLTGLEIKNWLKYHSENQTSHSKTAKGMLRFMSISDSESYTLNMKPSGTGSGEVGRYPTVERVSDLL